MIYQCKMCGGDLNITDADNVVECDYCGTVQTVPFADDEKKMALFNRANRLRLANEFDKAAGIYESIVAQFPREAEAYWGLCLCNYGIEYVDDPASGKKIPTCHRSSFTSILEDDNFDQTLENADVLARKVYRDEAKVIEEIRKGILEVSSKEAPYDIFICYKETDTNGERTVDSVIAQDVYDALTQRGYRVFFSRITLEDKLGQEYEPYIFAALNSAKVMLVFGTDYEHFNAVWVKNEWNRFLLLVAKEKDKVLIPCYKGVDAYDMPREFAKFQAQDMGKVGAMQDLLRGIEKIFGKSGSAARPAAQAENSQVENIKKLARLSLNSGNIEGARTQFMEAARLTSGDPGVFFGLALTAATEAEKRSYLSEVRKLSPQVSAGEAAFINADNAKEVLLLYALAEDQNGIRFVLERFPAVAGTWFEAKNERYQLLHKAVENNDLAFAQLLIAAGADVNTLQTVITKNGKKNLYSALYRAIWKRKDEALVRLLIQAGANVNLRVSYTNESRYEISCTPLIAAIIEANNPRLVSMLLAAGANPDEMLLMRYKPPYPDPVLNESVLQNDTRSYTPLDRAIAVKNENIVYLLLQAKANVNLYSKYKSGSANWIITTPLFCAISKWNNLTVVQMLLNAGADWNAEVHFFPHKYRINKYPFHKDGLPKEFLSQLHQLGWKGGGLF